MDAAKSRKAQIEHLREEFRKHGIRKAKLGGFDVDGVLRGKYVSLDKFWGVAESGLGFCDVIFGWDSGDALYDNASVTGWHTGYPDAHATVDLSTYRRIPWEEATAAFLLDFEMPVSPRGVLQKVEQKARAMGFSVKCASEYEFFLFKETPESVRAKGYAGLNPLSPGMFGYSWLRASENAPLVHDLQDKLAAFDVELEGFHTETGPGVYEAAIRYDGLMRAADKAALFKTAVKEICARHGVMPCFMAKWNKELPGCSGHLHESLWTASGESAFLDQRGPRGMSKTLQHFVAGQVALMPAFTALIAPTINSYKRMVRGAWSPTMATWGVDNRTTALRVIPGSPSAIRVEYRLAAADMNPYIAMAASVASGLYGIEHELPLPVETEGNGYDAKVEPLPATLREATARLSESKEARDLLGSTFVDHYVRTREWECRQFEGAVTRWELERYFEII
ncbi:MAG: glutamine synthetase [Deltaproteobacteria bacterium]|nr:MAG: glutamine synthetase [Deltaproteobacteria bacterium]